MKTMMTDFTCIFPTRIIFGKSAVNQLGEQTAKYGERVLLVYGQGSIKKTGLYDRAMGLLKDNGLEIFELGGVLPNPRLSTCEEGARICKENNIQVIVAVGGGSVLDTAKSISAGALDDGELWDFHMRKRLIEKTLPVISVMTVAATGSEYDGISVMKNEKTHEKRGAISEHLFPRVSILDPQLTYTVPPDYTAYGGFDIISHVLEPLIDAEFMPLIQVRFMEALIKTVMESIEKAQANPEDYEARSYLMWASALACNDILSFGTGACTIAGHAIESGLGGVYDTPHGAGLAVIMPALMKYRLSEYTQTTARFAEQVMNIERKGKMTDTDIALEGIEAFRRWLKKVGCPITLKELGARREDFDKIIEKVVSHPCSPDRETVLGALETYYE
jgi:alcohol dehydrogenase